MQLQVLGPVQATDDGETVALGGPRQRAVLALLVAFVNGPVSADRLIDEIWGEEPPPEARNSLQSMISNLRKALSPDPRFAIERSGRSYELVAPEDGVDSLLFAAKVRSARELIDLDLDGGIMEFDAALALWRGAPYGDADEADSLRADAARLEELRLRALERRIEGQIAAGGAADVVSDLELLVDEHPLREGLHRLLMVALVQAGRQAEALRVAARLRHTLGAELGIEPSPELVLLEQQILDQSVETPAVPATDAANPYRGLEAFVEADSDIFFGRERLTERLVDRLNEEVPGSRFLAVVGASGSGKSSVVRAGLIPAIRRGAVDGSADWIVIQMVPGKHPLHDLEAGLLRIAANPPPTLLEQLERDELGMRDAANRILPGEDSELLLVVDQFEELFTVAEPDEADLFLRAIAGAATSSGSRVRVVVTLRADFYDRPLSHPTLAPLLAARHETVVAMTPDEMSEAIVGPAQSVGFLVEPGLVAAVIADATGQPGALPLVQYALTELFHHQDDGTMKLDAYREFGGVRGAIGRRAESLFESLEDEGRRDLREVMLQLVTLGEGEDDTRRRVYQSDLVGDQVDLVLTLFGKARLLSFDKDPVSGVATVEVAHEALLREWPRLGSWIDEGREDIRLRRRLEEATKQWESAGRDPSYLLAGQRLRTFEEWSAGRGPQLAATMRALLDESVAADAAERRKRATARRRIQVTLAVATVVSLVFGVLAVIRGSQAARDARIAEVRELAASAIAAIDTDAELAVLLAVEAAGRDPIPAALEALHQAIAADRQLATISATGAAAAFVDGETIATLGDDGVIGLYSITDPSQPELAATIGEPGWLPTTSDSGGPPALTASPNGRRLAVSTPDGVLTMLDLATGQSWSQPIGGTSPQVAFAGDGSIIAARSLIDGSGGVASRSAGGTFDAETGQLIQPIPECCGAAVAITTATLNEPAKLIMTSDEGFKVLTHHDLSDMSIVGRTVAPVGVAVAAGNSLHAAISVTPGEVRVFHNATGELATPIRGHTSFVIDLDIEANSSRVATAAADGTVRVWDARSGAELLRLSARTTAVLSVEFAESGNRLLTVGADGVGRLWDITDTATGEVAAIRFTDSSGFEPSGGVFIAGSSSVLLRHFLGNPASVIYDLETGSSSTIDHAGGDVFAVAPNGRTLAIAERGRLALFDLPGESQPVFLEPPSGEPLRELAFAMDYSPDGTMIAISSAANTIDIYSTSPPAYLATVTHREGSLAGASFDSQNRLVSASPGGVATIADPISGEVSWSGQIAGDHPVVGGAIRGQTLVAIDAAGNWWSFDLDTLEPQHVVEFAHSGGITALAISSDGTILATAGAGLEVSLWDLQTGERVMNLTGATREINSLSFNEDTSQLMVVGRDQVARIYTLDAETLVAIGKSRASRPFTEAECRLYLHTESCE